MSAVPGRARKPKAAPAINARGRIDRTVDELFSRHGIRAVGVDTVVAHSGVAKMTLYRHYPSKGKLALAFLNRRGLWMREWLREEIERRAQTPGGQLLAVFDTFTEWFNKRDFEGCALIRLALEHSEAKDPLRKAVLQNLSGIRALLRQLAADAGIADPEVFSRQWHILMKGSIVSACEGDLDAARRAKDVASLLLARENIASV